MIEAEADGKRAALAIHEHLGGGVVPRARSWFHTIALNRSGDHYDRVPRQSVPVLPVARRTGFREVEEGFDDGPFERDLVHREFVEQVQADGERERGHQSAGSEHGEQSNAAAVRSNSASPGL